MLPYVNNLLADSKEYCDRLTNSCYIFIKYYASRTYIIHNVFLAETDQSHFNHSNVIYYLNLHIKDL